MAISKTLYLALIVTLVSVELLLFNANIASAQCKGNFQDLLQQCGRYVKKDGPEENPSPECCNILKNVDVQCVCLHVPPQAEQMISMEKAAFVVAACGNPLPSGAKCGSYIVPPTRVCQEGAF